MIIPYALIVQVFKHRPNITVKEEDQTEKAKKLNDIATEQEKIKYARLKYYKGCVEEPEIKK